jgi:hypothetical protein
MGAWSSNDNANEIIPGFWIGNYKSAHDIDFLRENSIQAIVNCTPDIPYISELIEPEELMTLQSLYGYRIPVYDSLQERDIRLMELYLPLVIPWIYHKYIKEGKNILVHCRAGKMRSGVVGLSFLYFMNNYAKKSKKYSHPNNGRVSKSVGKTEREITDHMLSKRPKIFGYGLRNNFRDSFIKFFGI